MDKQAVRSLCSGIITQAVEDFKKEPNLRFEVEAFFISPWGAELLTEMGLSYRVIDDKLQITETNKRHRKFLRELRTLEGTEDKPSIERLADMLGWSIPETIAHDKEYRMGLKIKEKANEDAALC